jgi:D-alanyl-D-alanine carboxypeptidase
MDRRLLEDEERPVAGCAWARYGFVPSYPNGAFDRTCYAAEPWHFRWVGREHAAAASASGLTLREWLWSVSVDQTLGHGHARSVG